MQGVGWVWLEALSFLPMDPCLDAFNPEQMDSSSKLGLGRTFFKVWAGSGTRMLVLIEMKPCPRLSNLEPVEPVSTRQVQRLGLGLARGL